MVAVAGVAIPQFSRAMTYVELRKSTQAFAGSLRQVRNDSISRSQVGEIVFDAGQQVLRTAQEDIVYDWPDEVVVQLAGVEPSIANQAWPIRFYPDGSATAAEFNVSALQRHYVVVVDWLTGRIRVL